MRTSGRHFVLAVLLLVYGAGVQCSINVDLSASEYYRLTGHWRLEGVRLLEDGVATSEHVSVPECVHTVTMDWYSLHHDDHLQYTVSELHSAEPLVLPILLSSVPWWGVVPASPDTMSLQFRCNGSGDARVDVTIAVSNHSHHGYHNSVASHYTFSMMKRCGSCDDNGGFPGESCDNVQCVNGGHCKRYHDEVCVCPQGYHGVHCELAWCHPNCENGGHCVKPDKCRCPKGFTGNRCHRATCHPECKNGGRCAKVGVCQCNRPYYGVRCEQRGHIRFIHTPRRSICVQVNNTVVLNCDVMATPTTRITWLRNGRRISKADHHYLMLHDHHPDGTLSSVLLIYDAMATDNGWYTCLASNSAVTRRTQFFVMVSQCGVGQFSGNGIDDDDDDDTEDSDDDVDDNDFD